MPQTSAASTPPVVSESPTPATAEASARNGALVAYRGFRAAQVAAEATADPHQAALQKYAGDKALAQEVSNLMQLQSAGIVVTGEPTLSPQVVSVTLGSSPVVVISDCVDAGNWQPVYQATGKSAAPPGQPTRMLSTAQARPYADGWLITEIATDRSQPC